MKTLIPALLVFLASISAHALGESIGPFQVRTRAWLNQADRLTQQQIDAWAQTEKSGVVADARATCRAAWGSDLDKQISDWSIVRFDTPGSSEKNCEWRGTCQEQHWVTLEADFSCARTTP